MQDPLLGLIDYGSGNLRSVGKALAKIGARVELLASPERLDAMDAVVLPGVGSLRRLRQPAPRARPVGTAGRMAACRPAVFGHLPGLPACLFESSEETPGVAGFGRFAGSGAALPVTRVEGPADRLELPRFSPARRAALARAGKRVARVLRAFVPPDAGRIPAWWLPRRTTADLSPPPSSRAARWGCSSTPKKARRPVWRCSATSWSLYGEVDRGIYPQITQISADSWGQGKKSCVLDCLFHLRKSA